MKPLNVRPYARSAAIFSIILFLLSIASPAQTQQTLTEITGRLVGGDGKPMEKAFVALSRGYSWLKMVAVVETDERGNFKLTTDKRGLFYVIFRGVNNGAELVPLVIDRSRRLRIDVKLSVPEYDLDEARVAPGMQFRRQTDGTYALDVQTKEKQYAYAIGRGYKVRGAFQGTDPGPIEIDKSGMLLRRVAIPVDGKVTSHIDPAKLPRPSGPTEVHFADPRSLDARLYAIYHEIDARNSLSFQPKPRSASQAEISSLLARINAETNPLLQKALWLSYLDLTIYAEKADPVMVRKALDVITSTSPIWVLDFPDLPRKAVAIASQSEKYADYEREVISVMPADDRVGKPIPAFSAQSFDDPQVSYTNSNIKAKVYLIDFWATWCGPCLGQMPYLRRAYEKYHSKGFEILSFSVDKTRDVVASFRKRKDLSMPWLNAMDPQLTELRGEIPRQFQVAELPAEFLVDARGKILATTYDLQGDDLDKVLSAAFARVETNAATELPPSPVAYRTYKIDSKLMGRPIPYNIILPSNYDVDSSARFPVIYLLHGLNGSYRSMSETAAVLEECAKHQFIVVTPDGGRGFYTDSALEQNDQYESYLIQELIPAIDRQFRTISDRSARAIAGASMGGYGALKFGAKYPGTFALVGSWSGAVNAARWRNEDQLSALPFTAIAPSLKKDVMAVFGDGSKSTLSQNDLFQIFTEFPKDRISELPFFFFDCGSEDEIKLFEPNRELDKLMSSRNIPHQYKDHPGGHELQPTAIPNFLVLAERTLSKAKK